MFDKQEISKAISLMKPDNQIFEIRVIYENKKDESDALVFFYLICPLP